MDTTLVTVTVLSMGMAAALSAIVWRMLRLERRRFNARVAGLSALAAASSTKTVIGHDASVKAVGEASAKARPVLVERDLPIRDERVGDGGAGGLFAEPERESPWSARFAVMAALALIVASVVFFSLVAHAPKAARKTA